MNKERIKGIVIGFILCAVLTTSTAVLANQVTRSITVTSGHINLVVNGEPVIPRDGQGNIVEPFVYDGTTFLPVRALANALGQEVDWDGDTYTVYIGQAPSAVVREIHLFNSAFLEVGYINWFRVSGDEHDNMIRLKRWNGNWWTDDARTRSNHIVYPLEMSRNATFEATIVSHEFNQMTKVYRFYGDGTLLWTSPVVHNAMAPMPISIDVSGIAELRIEVDITCAAPVTRTISPLAADNFGGLQNARVVIGG